MNLLKEEDRNRLFTAMEISYRKLEPFRNLNTSLIEEFAGSAYGGSSSRVKYEMYINLMGQAVDAYTMALVANRPRVIANTNRVECKFFAKHYSQAINNLIQEIELDKVLQRWVKSAFFMLGIIKVHREDAGEADLFDGQRIDPGKPMASNVSLDNWCHDMSATRWDQIKFASDCYRVPFADLEDDDRFDQKVVKELQPTPKISFTGQGDRAEMLSKDYVVDGDEVEPMIDLMDIWIPREQKIYTFAMDGVTRFRAKHKPLADFDWEGPGMGPYHYLSFGDVPENIMPSAPALHLASLARLVNNLIRKQARQAQRQKDINIYTPAGAKSAEKIKRTSDGEWVEVQDTKEVGVLKQGGVDPGNQAFAMHAIDLLDRQAGNLPSLLGLGSQADTLGQEQLIAGATTKKVAQMGISVMDATRKLIRNLGFMLWHDSAKIIPGRVPLEGVQDRTIDATWTPEYRMGDFYDYDLDIDVFSMGYQPPQQKAQTLLQLLQGVYIPAMPIMQQQGASIDFQELNDTLAELFNMPRLKDIVKFAAPPQGENPAPPGQDNASSVPTTRNYVRRSVSDGPSQQGKNTMMQQALMAKAGLQGTGNAMGLLPSPGQ